MPSRVNIVVDWGTSNFRAYRFSPGGILTQEHHAASGILSVQDRDFEAALEREIGAWLHADCDVFLSGMITSRNGWHETPYVEVPAELAALMHNARERQARCGARLRFLPGVCVREPFPDVMRGEEIQVFGAITPQETATIILPGTHSKWVRVENGRMTTFRTFLTGEMFALLKTHSIIGRLVPADGSVKDDAAFLAGVRHASGTVSSGLLHDVFTARSGALLGRFGPEEIEERLSGLVIGHEIRAGLALGWPGGALRLVGEAALCRRYALALEALGQACEIGPARAVVAGFERLAALQGASA